MVTIAKRRERVAKLPQLSNARGMRAEPTAAELRFWYEVRNRRLSGHKFRRQYLIGNYIADFVCVESALVVELDGGQHASQTDYDEKRDAFIRQQGFRVIRLWNADVLGNTEAVMEAVLRELAATEKGHLSAALPVRCA